MRQLHFVGFTSDHDGLILAGRRGAKTGNFVITIDDELVEHIEEARVARVDAEPISPALPPRPPRSRIQSALSPREMQTRLRAGRTVAQVAAEAGVDIEWVERFAAPVLAEQAAAIVRAQELVLRTPRRGQSDRGLASSVRRNLADRGILLLEEEFDSAWSAHQLADNDWIIRFRYRSRGRDQQAEYLLDTAAATLTPNNRLATELGYVDPGRRAPPVRELPPMRVRRSQRGGRRAKKEVASAKKAPPAKKTVAKRPAAKKVAAGRRTAPAKKTSGARKATRSRARATTRPASVSKKRVPAKKVAATRKSASAKRTASAKKPGTGKKSTAKRAPAKRAAAAKKTSTGKRATPRKSAAPKQTTPARRSTPAKKATPANRATRAKRPAANKRLSGSVAHVRMTADGPRVRPLRAHRVETSGARNGSTHGVGVRTSASGLPAMQFRLGGPNAWGFPGPGG